MSGDESFGAETPVYDDSSVDEDSVHSYESAVYSAEPATTEDLPALEPTDEAGLAPEPVAVSHTFALDGTDPGLADARSVAQRLAGSLRDLEEALDAGEAERAAFVDDRRALCERVHYLEGEAERKEAFKAALISGAGAALTVDDLNALQSMTDALTADPDRLTLLFSVVQQASKLAAIVNVYSSLRQMAEEA